MISLLQRAIPFLSRKEHPNDIFFSFLELHNKSRPEYKLMFPDPFVLHHFSFISSARLVLSKLCHFYYLASQGYLICKVCSDFISLIKFINLHWILQYPMSEMG